MSQLDNNVEDDQQDNDVHLLPGDGINLDGKLYSGKPQEIALTSHLEIAIVIGRAPALIPATWPFDSPA